MNLKDNLSKFQAKADEGIFLGYSHNLTAYRVLNKCTRKVEETFNLNFDYYYAKQVDKHFEQNPIINESSDESGIESSSNFDYDLIFGVPDRAVNAEVHANDNHQSESLKHFDDSEPTQIIVDSNSTSNSPGVGESMHNNHVEGEHLDSNTMIEGEHSFEGENERRC